MFVPDEATRQLLADGYGAFTIAGVRDALGLSSGSMFHAFASKPALVGEVYVEGMRDYQATAIAAITGHADPAAAVEAWITAHLGWVSEHRDLARFLFSTQPGDVIDASAPALTEANAAFYKAVADLLNASVAAGLMAPTSLAVGHSVLMGAVQEYCRRWTRGTAADDPGELVPMFQRAAIAAMRSTISKENP